jgi:hypothetical protein
MLAARNHLQAAANSLTRSIQLTVGLRQAAIHSQLPPPSPPPPHAALTALPRHFPHLSRSSRLFSDGGPGPYQPKDWADTSVARGRGVDVLHDPVFNKGTAHPLWERERLGLRGLLPPRVLTMQQQVDRTMAKYWHGDTWVTPDDEAHGGISEELVRRWHVLNELHDRNESLFFKILVDNFVEMAPVSLSLCGVWCVVCGVWCVVCGVWWGGRVFAATSAATPWRRDARLLRRRSLIPRPPPWPPAGGVHARGGPHLPQLPQAVQQAPGHVLLCRRPRRDGGDGLELASRPGGRHRGDRWQPHTGAGRPRGQRCAALLARA